jgi:hypothetical protein
MIANSANGSPRSRNTADKSISASRRDHIPSTRSCGSLLPATIGAEDRPMFGFPIKEVLMRKAFFNSTSVDFPIWRIYYSMAAPSAIEA